MVIATEHEIVLDPRFNGPPETANGGYACGRLAAFVDGPAEVTLRRPPALGRPLRVTLAVDGAVLLHDGGALVAEARPVEAVTLDPPVRPSPADAVDASTRQPGRTQRHLLSDCFVCGPYRADGMGVGAGPLASDPEVGATPFAAARWADGDGRLAPELVWAALDCPSFPQYLAAEGRIALLARLTADATTDVPARDDLVVVGWPLARDGRKHESASALLDGSGRVLARARALWIEPRGG